MGVGTQNQSDRFYGAHLTANSANPGGLPKRFEVTLKDGTVYEFNYSPGTFFTGIRDRFENRVILKAHGGVADGHRYAEWAVLGREE